MPGTIGATCILGGLTCLNVFLKKIFIFEKYIFCTVCSLLQSY